MRFNGPFPIGIQVSPEPQRAVAPRIDGGWKQTLIKQRAGLVCFCRSLLRVEKPEKKDAGSGNQQDCRDDQKEGPFLLQRGRACRLNDPLFFPPFRRSLRLLYFVNWFYVRWAINIRSEEVLEERRRAPPVAQVTMCPGCYRWRQDHRAKLSRLNL